MGHGTWSVRSWNASSLNYDRDAFIWIDEGGDRVQVAARLADEQDRGSLEAPVREVVKDEDCRCLQKLQRANIAIHIITFRPEQDLRPGSLPGQFRAPPSSLVGGPGGASLRLLHQVIIILTAFVVGNLWAPAPFSPLALRLDAIRSLIEFCNRRELVSV
jgi:hypothetical protein